MTTSYFIYHLIAKFRGLFIYPWKFAHYGKHSLLLQPMQLESEEHISIGNRVFIYWQVRLSTEVTHPGIHITIGDGCCLGGHNQIMGYNSVVLEDHIITAENVFISDNLHGYDDPVTPIMYQPLRPLQPVRIGAGSWIGRNVCILGASIGKHCVIGSNAVVTHDIPDYSVAVGAPAKVIKQYDFTSKQWKSVNV